MIMPQENLKSLAPACLAPKKLGNKKSTKGLVTPPDGRKHARNKTKDAEVSGSLTSASTGFTIDSQISASLRVMRSLTTGYMVGGRNTME